MQFAHSKCKDGFLRFCYTAEVGNKCSDSGKAVQSDEFTVNVDAVTKITIDKTDTYMNVGMTGTLTTAFETIGNPTDSEKSVKWNSSAPKTVSVKDGVITALKAGTATLQLRCFLKK